MRALKHSSDGSVVEIPMFSKGRDDRLEQARHVRGKIDVVLFEGWRLGVQHPNFFPYNRLIDTMIFLQVDFAHVLAQKFEPGLLHTQSLGVRIAFTNMIWLSQVTRCPAVCESHTLF